MNEISNRHLNDFCELIYELTGINMGPNKKPMLTSRINKRLRQLSMDSFAEYIEMVKNNADEKNNFIDLVTTNETSFFRTTRIWDYIENKYLPEWFANNPNAIFNAWSAASSTGEEAHTLGIICQQFKNKNPKFRYGITGTDISNEVLGEAAKGLYSGRKLENFQQTRPELFNQYMTLKADKYEVNSEVRSKIKFTRHNLFSVLPVKEKFDLVLLRNVFIYFKSSDQEKVLQNVECVIKPDSFLIMGESESLIQLKTNFTPVQPLIYKSAKALVKAG